MASITFRPRFARRLPEPFQNTSHAIERHVFHLWVTDLPSGLALARGMKPPRTRWDVYRDVQASLVDKNCTPGIFHLKSRGITLVAREVRKIDEDDFEVDVLPGQGIVDGGHIYRLIIEAQQNPDVRLPKNQFVKVEILTRVPEEWLGEICAGLNTPIAGYSDSLLPLQDALAWIKDELRGETYFKSIAWSESERGIYDVRDILDLLTCFNTTFYPNAGGTHPVVAYENRSVVIASFEQDYRQSAGAAFKKLRPLLKDILVLHDIVRLEFPKLMERKGPAMPDLVERATKKPHEFPFLNARSTEQLARGALLPVVAAFRWVVEDDPTTGLSRWRGGFASVLERWRTSGDRLVGHTVEKCRELGGGADAIGRSQTHWGGLHKEIAFLDLLANPARPAPPPGQDEGGARPADR